jgi:hypothetical protein
MNTDTECGLRPPDLDDPDLFVARRSIPILDEHQHSTKGDIDEGLLQLLAENSNARAEGTGNYALIFVGHTDDEGDEDDQPDVVGYARNFRVSPFMGRPCLYADLYFYKSDYKRAMKYPHRSVERFRSEEDRGANFIDAIALLKRTPERDLGLLVEYARGGSLVRYSRDLPPLGSGEVAITPDPAGTEVVMDENTMNMLVSKIVEAVKGVLDGSAEGPPPGDDGGLDDLLGGDDGGDPLADAAPGGPAPAPAPAGDMPPEEGPEKYAAGVAAGANTFAPGQVKGKVNMSKSGGSVSRYSAADIEGIVRENQKLRSDVAKIVKYNRNVARKEVLSGLYGEGYNLDVDQEVKENEELSDAQFDAHVRRIKERYGRRIDGRGFIPTAAARAKRDDVVSTADEAARVVEYATANKIQFNVARQQMKEKGLI